MRGSGSEQHVGEASGRRASVQAVAARHLEVGERRQRSGELVPAARDVVGPGVITLHRDRRVVGDLGRGLRRRLAGHQDLTGGDQVGRLNPRPRQAAAYKLRVQSRPLRHRPLTSRPSGPGRQSGARRAPRQAARGPAHRRQGARRRAARRVRQAAGAPRRPEAPPWPSARAGSPALAGPSRGCIQGHASGWPQARQARLGQMGAAGAEVRACSTQPPDRRPDPGSCSIVTSSSCHGAQVRRTGGHERRETSSSRACGGPGSRPASLSGTLPSSTSSCRHWRATAAPDVRVRGPRQRMTVKVG